MKTKDPVCGMQVNPKSAAGAINYNGTTYYFCSQACMDSFKSDPKKYTVQPEMHK